jgi:polar amino acid transport system substrate-binding protein
MRILVVIATVATIACGLPRDADGTLDRVRNGSLRIGVAVDTPWVTDSSGVAGGVEGWLATEIARGLRARPVWVRGPHPRLLTELAERRLDLVIGGLDDSSPWSTKVALTKPYFEKHVLAVPLGENAWLVHVERELRAREATVAAHLRATAR